MLTQRWRALALLLAALALGACSALGLGQGERTIVVSGEGSTVVPPDTVIVTLGVQTRGTEVGPTVAANNETAQQVIQAVTQLGVTPEDVQTTSFSIWGQQHNDEFGKVSDEVTYFVDNTVTITLHDVAVLGTLLGEALDSGANSVQSLTYTLADPSAALAPARSAALTDAQRQADQLASESGVTLGPILTVVESTGGAIPGLLRYSGEAVPAASDVPTSPGTLEYRVQLSVTYGIR
jgi:uncharacterized protein YggE